MAIAERAKLIAELALEDKLSKGLATASKNVGRFDKGLGRTGKGVAQFGKGMAKTAVVAGAALATGLAVATKTFIDFDDAFASVRKNVEGSPAEIAKLNDQLHQLATRIPVSFTDLTGIAAEAGALGIATPDVIRFTETIARLSAATQGLSVEAASEAFGKFRNSLHLTEDDIERSASALVQLGKTAGSSEGDIIEVAKRFAGAGHTAGLTAAQILGISSAIESLGVAPEAAGGSLSRLFNNINKFIGTGDKKLQAFAKTSGETTKQFARNFQKDALGTFQKFLAGLSKLSGPEQQKRLAAAGVVNVRDISALQLLAQSWQEVAKQTDAATDAYKANTALAQTSAQRFDTLKSKLQVVGNNAKEAAFLIAEGFTPALGRAADKLTAFLQLSSNRSDLQEIGQKLGKTLDKIDFDRLLKSAKSAVDALQPMVDVLLTIANALNALPTEVKGVALGAIVANKVSGGALAAGAGNIVGGLAETLTKSLASKIPVFGKAFVQPVFVTNLGPGGLGGGLGSAAGGGSAALLAKLGIAALAVGAVVEVQQQVSAEISGMGKGLEAKLASGIDVKTPAELQTALDAVNTGINKIQANPLNVLVQGSALDSLRSMKSSLESQLIVAKTGKPGIGLQGIASTITSGIANALQKAVSSASAMTKLERELRGLQERERPLRHEQRQRQRAGNDEGARLLAIRLAGIDQREKIIAAGITRLRTSIHPDLDRLSTHLEAQQNRLGNLTKRLHVARESHDTRRAADLRQKVRDLRASMRANTRRIDNMKETLKSTTNATRDAARRAGSQASSAAYSSGDQVAAAMNAAAGSIVGAIYAARPVIQSTNITRSTTVVQRYGQTGGSRDTSPSSGP